MSHYPAPSPVAAIADLASATKSVLAWVEDLDAKVRHWAERARILEKERNEAREALAPLKQQVYDMQLELDRLRCKQSIEPGTNRMQLIELE